MKKMNFSEIKSGYDIVVVGAGAAGCSFLNSVGPKFNVLCIDNRKFPRFKACSGILVNAGKEFFNNENIPDWVFADKKPLDLTYLDLDNNLHQFSKKSFVNTWRKELDRWLFEKNNKNSIDFVQDCKFIDFHYTSDKKYLVVVCESNGAIKTLVCKYLIGCDGANSTVRKKISRHNIRYYVAIQEVIDMKFEENAYFIFDSTITDFYGWIIPKGDKVEIGCAVEPYKAKEKYDQFKKKIENKFRITGNGKIESALILRPKKFSDIILGDKNVLLCGEAAALITPSSAEGISNALRSGKFCAEAINEAFDFNPLQQYKDKSEELLQRLKSKFKKSEIISNSVLRKSLFS